MKYYYKKTCSLSFLFSEMVQCWSIPQLINCPVHFASSTGTACTTLTRNSKAVITSSKYIQKFCLQILSISNRRYGAACMLLFCVYFRFICEHFSKYNFSIFNPKFFNLKPKLSTFCRSATKKNVPLDPNLNTVSGSAYSKILNHPKNRHSKFSTTF